jgi:hypothetical protein
MRRTTPADLTTSEVNTVAAAAAADAASSTAMQPGARSEGTGGALTQKGRV